MTNIMMKMGFLMMMMRVEMMMMMSTTFVKKGTFLVNLPGNRRGCLSQSKQTTGVPTWLHDDDEGDGEDGDVEDEHVLEVTTALY